MAHVGLLAKRNRLRVVLGLAPALAHDRMSPDCPNDCLLWLSRLQAPFEPQWGWGSLGLTGVQPPFQLGWGGSQVPAPFQLGQGWGQMRPVAEGLVGRAVVLLGELVRRVLPGKTSHAAYARYQ